MQKIKCFTVASISTLYQRLSSVPIQVSPAHSTFPSMPISSYESLLPIKPINKLTHLSLVRMYASLLTYYGMALENISLTFVFNWSLFCMFSTDFSSLYS